MQAIVRRQHRQQVLTRTVVSGTAVAMLIVGLVVVAGRDDRDALTPVDSTPSTESPPEVEDFDVPEDQMAVIRELVGAVSRSDADGFIDRFASDGSFTTRGVFTEGEWYSFNDGARLYTRETPLVEAWFAMNRAWGFEAELRSCSSSSVVPGESFDQSVACEVAVRWPKLSLEIVEGWGFELRGDEVTWWGTSADPEDLGQLDLDPSDRSLPLGYADIEAWESWLEANDPEHASIWLNPRNTEEAIVDAIGDPELAERVAPLLTPAQNSWLIDGHEFMPFGLIPYDPTFADEIQASIREYLASR